MLNMNSLRSLALAAVVALSFASVAQADQWTDADALYAQRGTGDASARIATIVQARALYLAILNGADTVAMDKIRAATQLGRLAAYQGEMIYRKNQRAERERIFSDCWSRTGFMEKINEAAVGSKVPEYYYFKGVCLAWWGEAVGSIRSLPQVPTVNTVMREALALDTRFEGGGAHRLVAGIRSAAAARALPGLYDLGEAERQVSAAIASAAYPGDQLDGTRYYENLLGLPRVLVEAGRKDEALAKYREMILVIERAERTATLPAGREPESLWVLDTARAELAALEQ